MTTFNHLGNHFERHIPQAAYTFKQSEKMSIVKITCIEKQVVKYKEQNWKMWVEEKREKYSLDQKWGESEEKQTEQTWAQATMH